MKIHSPLVYCLLMSMLGCQAYEPLSLDLDSHDQAWSNRLSDAGSGDGGSDGNVKAYAEQLAQLNATNAVTFDASDGLSLPEAELVALLFNAELRAARLSAKVPRLGAAEAGRWADPELDFDLLRIADSVKDPWIVGASLSFTIPLSGRLNIEKDKALADADVEWRRVLLAEWKAIIKLRVAWNHWSGTTQRITLVEQYLKQLDGVVGIAEKQRQANRIGAPQLRVLQLEKVTRVGQLNALHNHEKRERLALKAMLGLTPQAAFELHPTIAVERPVKDTAAHVAELRTNNLQLAVAKAAFDVADVSHRLEIRKQYPDLVIGPGYEFEEGVSRGGVVLSLPIPLLNRNSRAIAESRATRDAAKAAYESEYERLVATLAQAELGVAAARSRSQYLEATVAPMVDAQMKDLQRLASLGDLDVLVILDALTRTLETKTQVLDAKVEEAKAVNELRSLLRPMTTPQLEGSSND